MLHDVTEFPRTYDKFSKKEKQGSSENAGSANDPKKMGRWTQAEKDKFV